MNQNVFLKIVIVIVVLIFAGIMGYFVILQQEDGLKTGLKTILHPQTAPQADQVNWKTYRNNLYGFEFRYPPHLSVEVAEADGEERAIILREATKPQEFYYRVEVSPRPVASTLDQWFKGMYGDLPPEPVRRDITFAGLSALQVNNPSPGCQRDLIAVMAHGFLYIISEPSCFEEVQHMQTVEAINKTFKFIEPTLKFTN